MNLIVYSIPVFFLLIGIELLVSKMQNLSYYRLNDSITNLSCGIGQQVLGVFIKTFTFAGYIFIYEHSPMKGMLPNTWWMWTLLFVGIEFFYYWFHRMAHEVSFLWGSHIVHHQSEEYNLTVALRQAWMQGAFGWVFMLPLAAVGFEPNLFLVTFTLQTLYQFWIHTKLIGKLPAPIEFVFNTPSHHRVHHGVNPKYIDKNHGGTLIVFDRLFGTFQAEEEEVVFGVTKQPKSWNPLWLNFEYWGELIQDTFKAKNWSDKTKMLLAAPGWRPSYLGDTVNPKDVTPETFQKYDTEVSPSVSYYVLFQFVLLLVGTSLYLASVNKHPFDYQLPQKVVITGFIIFSVTNLGGFFENRKWVKAAEVFRLLAAVVLIGWIAAGS